MRPGSFADSRRGTRQSRGYGVEWERTRARILARDAGLCQPSLRAGLYVAATEVDHIVSKARRGTDADGNLQAISRAVHRAKTQAEAAGRVWDEAAYFRDQAQLAGAAAPGRGEGGVKCLAPPHAGQIGRAHV